MDASDPELLYASKEPDVDYLIQAYKTTQSDLGEWLDRRQRDWDVRNCQWAGKSNDFKKHSSLLSTGEVFPWNGDSDLEVRLADELIGCRVAMCMNAIRRAHIIATPTEHNDVARAAVISNFLRWLINSRMDEFYAQCELSLNHLFEKGLAVSYVYWDSHDLKQQQAIKMDEIAATMPEMAQIIADGSMDSQIVELLKENFKVSKSKGKAMLRELRKDGETTIPVSYTHLPLPTIYSV